MGEQGARERVGIIVVVLVLARLLSADLALAAKRGTPPQSVDAHTSGETPRPAIAVISPPPPVPPAVISRDQAGHATVRAIRLTEPLRVDGNLDEAVYGSVPPIDGFIQQLPKEGVPATEPTEAWVMFDDDTIYVAARCWDSAPPERWVVNEMRRDAFQILQNETFGVAFDTFYDRRNSFFFYTNPLGARADQTFTDEGNFNRDWNAIWEARTGRFQGGWTVEIAIPFKSLRYRAGRLQTWGVQFRRGIRHKNEWTYLTAVPASTGFNAVARMSAAATLVGLDLPPEGKRLEIKPYAISRVTTDRLQTPAVLHDPDANLGLDVKYGITANVTADLTYNTDFAQVEVDEQQVNLTRFSLLFPEKREFFLEGRGVMEFGLAPGNPGGANAAASAKGPPELFYSRRIGLSRNRVVPIDGGGRLVGKVGDVSFGLLNIQTDEESVSRTPKTNFTVMRVKRDILRRSTIGAMFTNRSQSTVAEGSNQAFGVDAGFSLLQDLTINGYVARTKTPGLTGDDMSYYARFDLAPDRYGVRVEHLRVGDHFNPEVGFVARDDFRRSFGLLRFSPRPRAIKAVRKFTWEGTFEYIENGAGAVETRQWTGRFNTEFDNSDHFSVEASANDELLVRAFDLTPSVAIPVGRYEFSDIQATYRFGQQRPASGSVTVQRGRFYDGTIAGLQVTGGSVLVSDQFSLEPSLVINRIELPVGRFTAKLARLRTDFDFSPRSFASALVQYNSTDHSFSSNLRLRWEYRPGSELFVVYTDEHDTRRAGLGLKNRAFVVKVNRLFRF